MFGIQLTRGTIRLQATLPGGAGHFELEHVGWRVWDGEVTDTAYQFGISGHYLRRDSTLVVYYDNPYGFQLSYVVRDEGKKLFSREHVAPGVVTTFEYTRP